jgi:hypothetical protein
MNRTTSNQRSVKRVGQNLFRSKASNVYYAISKQGGKQIRHSQKAKAGTGAAPLRRLESPRNATHEQ